MGDVTLAHHAHVFPESIKSDGTMDRLLRLMDACSIDRAVCFAPYPHQMESTDPNRWLAGELSHRPRLLGFGTIDVRRDDMKAQVEAVAGLGFKGLKLHPNAQQWDILSARAMQIYEAAQELDLLCTFHTGVHHYRIAHYNVLNFDEIAHHFPRLRFTMEHVGGYSFFNEALAVLVNNYPPPWISGKSRVFAGLTSVFTEHANRFWHLRTDQIMEIIHQTSIDQVIFGLDFP